MRRGRGRHKEEAIQTSSLNRLTRYNEMADVGWIEAPSKDSNPEAGVIVQS